MLNRGKKTAANAASSSAKETIASARDWTQATLEKNKLPSMQIGVLTNADTVEVEIDHIGPQEMKRTRSPNRNFSMKSFFSSPTPPPSPPSPRPPTSPTMKKKSKQLRKEASEENCSSKRAETEKTNTVSQATKTATGLTQKTRAPRMAETKSAVFGEPASTEVVMIATGTIATLNKPVSLTRNSSSSSQGSLTGMTFGALNDPRLKVSSSPPTPPQKARKLTRAEKKKQAAAARAEKKKEAATKALATKKKKQNKTLQTQEAPPQKPLDVCKPPTAGLLAEKQPENSSGSKSEPIPIPDSFSGENKIERSPSDTLSTASYISMKKSVSWQEPTVTEEEENIDQASDMLPENSLLESMPSTTNSTVEVQHDGEDEVLAIEKHHASSSLYNAPSLLQDYASEEESISTRSLGRKTSALKQLDDDQPQFSQGYLDKLEKRSPDYFFEDDEYMEKLEMGGFDDLRSRSSERILGEGSWEYTDDDEEGDDDDSSLGTDDESVLSSENHNYVYDFTEKLMPNMMQMPSDFMKQMKLPNVKMPNLKMPEIQEMKLPPIMGMSATPEGSQVGASSPQASSGEESDHGLVDDDEGIITDDEDPTDDEEDPDDGEDPPADENDDHRDDVSEAMQANELENFKEDVREEFEEPENRDAYVRQEELTDDDYYDRNKDLVPASSTSHDDEPITASVPAVRPTATETLGHNDDFGGLSDLEERMSGSYSADEEEPGQKFGWLGSAYLSSSGSQGASDGGRDNSIVDSKDWRNDYIVQPSMQSDIDMLLFQQNNSNGPSQPKLHPTIRVVGTAPKSTTKTTKVEEASALGAPTARAKPIKTSSQKKKNVSHLRSSQKQGLAVYDPTVMKTPPSRRGSRPRLAGAAQTSTRQQSRNRKSSDRDSFSSQSTIKSKQHSNRTISFLEEEEQQILSYGNAWGNSKGKPESRGHQSQNDASGSLNSVYMSLEL